ncbi:MAG: putative porin [Gammaproteobacteria bacterium]
MRPGTHLVGGKFKNPFYRPGDNGLIWDDDLRPEGISVQWDSGTFFASGSGFTAQENASRSDTFIFGAQLGGRLQFNEDIGLTVGVGYFDLSDVEGRPLLFAPDDSFGNSTATNTNGDLIYATGYQEVEAFAELAMKVNNLPLRMFVDYVNNTEADELDTGWAIGMTSAKSRLKGPGLRLCLRRPAGRRSPGLAHGFRLWRRGTDVRGHVLSGPMHRPTGPALKATYFINEIGEDLGTSAGLRSPADGCESSTDQLPVTS